MSNCLYLVSSSASREYVADCVEALALPRGTILHFRYRLEYVDETLFSSLPAETGTLPAKLRNFPVVVVYLFQEQTVGVWKPGDTIDEGPYLPLRSGRLIHAFKDGHIAHFFFEVAGYVPPIYRKQSTRVVLNKKVNFRLTAKAKKHSSYAHINRSLGFESARVDDTQSFQEIVEKGYIPGEWRTRSLGSAPLDITYDIIFYRIAGLFHEKGTSFHLVAPTHCLVNGIVLSEYDLFADENYHLRIATHLSAKVPRRLPGEGRATLRLNYDPAAIKPLSPTTLKISSLYDLEYWSFSPQKNGNDKSILKIGCEEQHTGYQRDFVRRELLCPEISLAISIKATQRRTR